ncbi:flagellar biosynthesis anti-sigma factor FlgM [Sandaracinobacteroides hominis]|uniref:flagellar biosynthesis anti-sigma factor FlgM n=1 Tax=Sandaracinobacteroides hominis TaxID=2780086 RepID=UPI001A9C9860|nr:flagellar biosynthesis anti-sigma factor FlgM [Sandaracinobacteroides hominis]
MDLKQLSAVREARQPKAVEPGTGARTAAAPAVAVSRDIASTAPVDTAKVNAVREQIASGSYKLDPARIADAMIRMEKGG